MRGNAIQRHCYQGVGSICDVGFSTTKDPSANEGTVNLTPPILCNDSNRFS